MSEQRNILQMVGRELVRTVTRTPQKALAKLTGRPWPPGPVRFQGVQNYPGAVCHRHGLTPADVEAIVGRRDPVILEIGANDGADSRRMLQHFGRLKLYCFEPDPRAIAKFKQKTHDPRCQLIEKAVAAKTGTTTFWQSGGNIDRENPDWDQSGSIHRPTGHLQLAPTIRFDSVIKVPTVSLDDWMAEHPEIDAIDLLWMDTQGAEHDVIQGAVRTLPKVRSIYSEFYQTPMYEGQRNLETLLGMLPGFKLEAIYEGYNFLARRVAVQTLRLAA